METPPIPPNCEWFFNDEQTNELRDKDNKRGFGEVWERRIIAAVARCAFMDEARAICEAEFNSRPPLDTDWGKLAETVAYRGALDNAELWRVWSQQ